MAMSLILLLINELKGQIKGRMVNLYIAGFEVIIIEPHLNQKMIDISINY